MAEQIKLTPLPSAQDFEGSAYRMEGPLVERLHPAGYVALGFVMPRHIVVDVFNPDGHADSEFLEACDAEGYLTSVEGGDGNLLQLRHPLDPTVHESALKDFVGVLSRQQPSL